MLKLFWAMKKNLLKVKKILRLPGNSLVANSKLKKVKNLHQKI